MRLHAKVDLQAEQQQPIILATKAMSSTRPRRQQYQEETE